MSRRTLTTLTLIATLGLLAGCGGSKKGSREQGAAAAGVSSSTGAGSTSSSTGGTGSSSTGGTGSSSTGGGAAALAVESVAQVGSQSEQRFSPGPAVALAFKLAGSGADVTITRVEVTNAGTIDEALLGEAKLLEDVNGNGEADAGDRELARAPRATANDAPYLFNPATPLAVAPNQRVQLLVTVDTAAVASAQQVALVGKTLDLKLASASAVHAEDAAKAVVTPTGTFPVGTAVVLEVNDTVLISEVCTGLGSGATSSEYLELFNASGKPVDLSKYYVTDYTDTPTAGKYYWKLPTGNNFAPALTSSDFFVKFPAYTLQPGQIITIAVDAMGFKAVHTIDPTFCLRNKGTSTAVQMLTWNGTTGQVSFVATPVGASAGLTGPSGGLTGGGEPVFLFTWDGTSDLIKDVDMINYGSGSLQNDRIDKSPNQRTTGGGPTAPDVKVDSAFDTDTTESTFQRETSALDQSNRVAPLALSIVRIDFSEGNEAKTGGNGLTGNDETSERFGDGLGGNGTFMAHGTATPGVIR